MFFQAIDLKIWPRKFGSAALLGSSLKNLTTMDHNLWLQRVLEACISAFWLCPNCPSTHSLSSCFSFKPLANQELGWVAPKSLSASSCQALFKPSLRALMSSDPWQALSNLPYFKVVLEKCPLWLEYSGFRRSEPTALSSHEGSDPVCQSALSTEAWERLDGDIYSSLHWSCIIMLTEM